MEYLVDPEEIKENMFLILPLPVFDTVNSKKVFDTGSVSEKVLSILTAVWGYLCMLLVSLRYHFSIQLAVLNGQCLNPSPDQKILDAQG